MNSGLLFRQVADLFTVTFPWRPRPHRTTIMKTFRFTNEGAMSYHRQGVPVSRAKSKNTLVILAAVEACPYMSVREISRLTSIPSSTVHRKLQNNNLHSYKVGIHQDLRPGDMERRMTFAQTMLETIEERPNTVSRIMFTDKKSFLSHHMPNKQNRRMWSHTNLG